MTKRDPEMAFKRLAKQRLRKAIAQIRLIGNLSDTSNYRYSTADADMIIRLLKQELGDLERRFQQRHPVLFTLDNVKSEAAG